jgi:hypothetical protein
MNELCIFSTRFGSRTDDTHAQTHTHTHTHTTRTIINQTLHIFTSTYISFRPESGVEFIEHVYIHTPTLYHYNTINTITL